MFKPGDKVVCVDPIFEFELGQVYLVGNTSADGYKIEITEPAQWRAAWRFKPVAVTPELDEQKVEPSPFDPLTDEARRYRKICEAFDGAVSRLSVVDYAQRMIAASLARINTRDTHGREDWKAIQDYAGLVLAVTNEDDDESDPEARRVEASPPNVEPTD